MVFFLFFFRFSSIYRSIRWVQIAVQGVQALNRNVEALDRVRGHLHSALLRGFRTCGACGGLLEVQQSLDYMTSLDVVT